MPPYPYSPWGSAPAGRVGGVVARCSVWAGGWVTCPCRCLALPGATRLRLPVSARVTLACATRSPPCRCLALPGATRRTSPCYPRLRLSALMASKGAAHTVPCALNEDTTWLMTSKFSWVPAGSAR